MKYSQTAFRLKSLGNTTANKRFDFVSSEFPRFKSRIYIPSDIIVEPFLGVFVKLTERNFACSWFGNVLRITRRISQSRENDIGERLTLRAFRFIFRSLQIGLHQVAAEYGGEPGTHIQNELPNNVREAPV